MNVERISNKSFIEQTPGSETLNNFLSHGLLPFVGRSREIEALIQFWRQMPEDQVLRTTLLVAEAGMGKSRVIDELTPHIAHNGGVILRIKLFTGGTLSLAHLLARAMRTNINIRSLIGSVNATMGSVINSLQRLVRLRPTLLVIEDIHWLLKDSLEDLIIFLEAMSQEYLRVLFVARPVAFDARSVIERYLISEIIMQGINLQEIKLLWERLFLSSSEEVWIEILYQVTKGNPLAIRSALRGAIQSRIIGMGSIGRSRWMPLVPLSVFQTSFEHYISILSDGLAAHLTKEELYAAEQFATIGEVVFLQTADFIIPNGRSMIERLVHTGIMNPVAATSIIGSSKEKLQGFVFTHTLIYRYMLKQASIQYDRLVEIISYDLPLHSIQPFELLINKDLSTISIELLKKMFDKWVFLGISPIIYLYDNYESNISNIVVKLLDLVYQLLPDQEREKRKAAYLDAYISIAWLKGDNKEMQRLIDDYLVVTKQIINAESIRYYRWACTIKMTIESREDKLPWEWWQEWKNTTIGYDKSDLEFLHDLGITLHSLVGTIFGDKVIKDTRDEVFKIYLDNNLVPNTQRIIIFSIFPTLVRQFESNEDIEKGWEIAKIIIDFIDKNNPTFDEVFLFLQYYEPFCFSLGWFDEVMQMYNTYIPLVKLRSPMARMANVWQFHQEFINVAWGRSIEIAATNAEEYLHNPAIGEVTKVHLIRTVVPLGLLLNNERWVVEYLNKHQLSHDFLSVYERFLLHIFNFNSLSSDFSESEIQKYSNEDQVFFLLILNDYTNNDNLNKLNHLLSRPLTRYLDFTQLRAGLEILLLVRSHIVDKKIVAWLHKSAENGIEQALNWLYERKLYRFISSLIERYHIFLSYEKKIHWNSISNNEVQIEKKEQKALQNLIYITMLGEVTVATPKNESMMLRGARNRTLLALLIAVQTMKHPPPVEEFYEIASGVKGDLSYAQHMTRNAMSRLKGMLGKNSIVRRSSLPRLNLDIVHVDILEVQHKLQQAMRMLAEGGLFQAYDLTSEVLKGIESKVPYPTQYEPFFEKAREDFEHSVRSVVLSLARFLIEEGDYDHAENLLRSGTMAIPQDEELIERLAEVLVTLNRSAEAERLLAEMAYR